MNTETATLDKKLQARMTKGLQALSATALKGNYMSSGTGTQFWVIEPNSSQEWPVQVMLSKKKANTEEQSIWLKPIMTGVVDADGNEAKAPRINLGSKFDDLQQLKEYIEDDKLEGPTIFVTVAKRVYNKAITEADIKSMEEHRAGSTANYQRAKASGEHSYILTSFDDEHLD